MNVRRLSMLLTAALAMSCSLGDPANPGSIDLFLEVDKATVPLGESVRVTVTARNIGNEVLTLTGPTGCLIYIEVLSTQGTVVYHSNGNCSGATVTEELGIGRDRTQVFTWDGSSLAGTRLPSGLYYVRGIARVTDLAYVGPVLSIALE